MKKTRKKLKISVMGRIVILFLIALFLSAGATLAISYSFVRENTIKEVSSVAQAVVSVIDATFGDDFTVKQLYDSEEEREHAHEVFH